METINIYELLESLPLMRGVSKSKILEIVGKTKFHFLKFLPDQVIAEPGDPCTHVRFLISGKVRSSITNNDLKFRVSQTITGPAMLNPEYLFGKSPFSPCSIIASEPCGILQIEKGDYLKMIYSDRAFLFNFLNVLSTSSQRSVEGLLALTTGDVTERLAYWIASLTQPEGSDIVMSCKQRDLYSIFGVQRSSLIIALDSLKSRGIIEYTNTEIKVISRSALVSILSGHAHRDDNDHPVVDF